MPGTIQVSVLDFTSPSTSSSSSIFLKVSMGRREFQTEDNGDFSFPLTSIRDNLVIVLQDANGNQISHTGIGTISIIEKGIWDDLFNLEGGGFVHMRLQFILSKEERNRIQAVRESAVKKRRSLSSIHNEVSDSQGTVVHNEVTITGELSIQLGKEENQETTRPLIQPVKTYPHFSIQNAADRSEETPSTSIYSPSNRNSLQKFSSTTDLSESVFSSVKKTVSADLKHNLLDKNSTNGYKLVQGSEAHGDVQVGPTMQKEASPGLGFSKQVLAAKTRPVFLTIDKSWSNKPKKRESLEIISGIRKRISAFESSPSQDTKTPVKPPPEKSQPDKVAIKISPNDQDFKDSTFTSESSSKIVKNSCTPKDLPPNPIKFTNTVDHSGPRKYSLSTIELQPILESKESRTIYNEENFEKNTEEKLLEEFSGPILVEPEKIYKRCDDHDFAQRFTNDEYENNSHNDGSLESMSYIEKEGNSYESVVYANDMRRLCLTTGGKEVIDLIEGLNKEEKNLFFTSEDERKSGTETKIKSEKKSADQECKKSDLESCGNNSCNGPFEQVIKIAVIVGFGLLLLLTTQSEPNRKSKRKGTEIFSASGYRMNQESLADEEW